MINSGIKTKQVRAILTEINRSHENDLIWQATALASKRFATSTKDITASRSMLFFGLIKQLYRLFLLRVSTKRLNKSDILFVTYFDQRIAKKDPYFYRLKAYLESKNISYTTLGITVGDENVIKELCLKNNQIITLESFIRYRDVFKTFLKLFRKKSDYFSNVSNKDIKSLLNRNFSQEYNSGSILKILSFYYGFKRYFQKYSHSKIIWPWENHHWERILILAHRELGHNSILSGYQHASSLLSWGQLFPAKVECESVPLPNEIYTTGPEATRVLIENGHFPQTCQLKDSCALRYNYTEPNIFKGFPEKLTVGIGLGLDKELNIKILQRVFNQVSSLEVIVRCHPLQPESDLRLLFEMPANGEYDNSDNLESFFERCSFLAYSSSSICMDALYFGKYLIYIDLFNSHKDDPLFKSKEFKLINYDTDNLENQIREVISKNTLKEEYDRALRYLESYFLPVTEERLKSFCDVK